MVHINSIWYTLSMYTIERLRKLFPQLKIFSAVCLLAVVSCTMPQFPENIVVPLPDPVPSPFLAPKTALTSRSDILSLIAGTTWYLDAKNGNDTTGSGLSTAPWKTLAKLHTVLQSGDCVMLRTGNYGIFDRGITHAIPTIYVNDEGHEPVFTGINLRDNDTPNHIPGDPETAFNSNLVFYGIKLVPVYVDPGPVDPMASDATSASFTKCARAVDLKWYGGIKIVNCRMSPSDEYGISKKFLSTTGINVVNAPDVWIEGCDIDSFSTGMNYTGAPRIRIYYNNIHGMAGGIISNGDTLSRGGVIEGNHLHDSNWSVDEPYCPRRSVADHYHGSFIAVRSCDTVIRTNIMHFGCNSSGVMLYSSVNIPYENILIEGNQIYYSNNVYALRLYNVWRNVIVRNNTLIGKGYYGSSGEYKYNTALAVHTFLGEAGGTRLFIHNNVLVGRLDLPDSIAEIELAGNIAYSTSEQLPEGNVLAYPDKLSYFESGFFSGALEVSWQEWEANGAGLANPAGHGTLLNLCLAPGSPAKDYGVAAKQASTMLGAMNANGFLSVSIPRKSDEHSAGAME